MIAPPTAIELGHGSGPQYRPSVSVVVPALDEQETLQHAVEWTISVLREISDDYEVVIVDDGSTCDDDRSCHARFADRRESIGISMRRLSPVALSNE